ncbi:metal-dependent hydrolase [Moraxella sp.]|uniref:metal-dependent hydrolase n=1 Tax=Moraxella sp. TaxID=479 RepID=UPI0026DAEE33|nr:metal-dependent hydrolase [Moraxella sp.]MDO4894576.1 metal-dependent hydrolase [Moraxella sp.]
MANFRTHLGVATVASTALSGGGFYLHIYGLSTAVLLAIIGAMGGLLPDIDLDHSKPAQQGFFAFALIGSTLITILYANSYQQNELILDSLILWAVCFLFLRYGIFEAFSRLTIHRGMVHSVPYMAFFGLILTLVAFYGLKLTAFVSWLFGIFLFLGGLVHLLLDELYSVNIYGLKLKKSFGTAFKFFERSKLLPYLCLYLFIAGLLYVAPPVKDILLSMGKLIK